MDRSVRETIAYIFGPFRLDPRRRVLTRNGDAVALTPTVFDTLLYLVEHPGRVIPKDELLAAIWPRRIVAEANVSQTIFTLRRALGDDHRDDRMIVTAPGQGYRFTPPVTPETPTQPVAIGQPPALEKVRGAGRFSVRLAIPWAVGAVALVVAGLLATHPWPPRQARSLVVIAEFQNLTRDPIFDRALGKALEIDLVQSPFVTVLSDRQAQDTLMLMARPRDARLTATLAAEVCQRNNGQAVLDGEIAPLGSQYLITLTAEDCADGAIVAAEKALVDRRDGVIAALDRLSAKVRRRLGESAASVRKFNIPIARQKTASLAALKAYSEGVYMFNHGSRLESVSLFQHALELDPQFAIAWSDIGRVYSNLHEPALARAAIEKAYALRDTVGEREKIHIRANYDEMVLRDLDATLRELRLWSETYPQDGAPQTNLANAENWLGHYPRAIEAGKRAVALSPGAEASYVVLARALMHGDQLEAAAEVCARAVAMNLAGDDTHSLLLEIAFARGDQAAEARELAWARGKPAEIRLITLAAEAAYRDGAVRRGDNMFATVARLSREQGVGDYNRPPTARELFDLGLTQRARELLSKIPADADSADLRFDLAEFGDASRAEMLLARDIKATPSDTLLASVSASEVRAALALRRRQPRIAIANLEPARPYEAKNYDIPYLRGLAYLDAGDGAAAAVEFRKVLDHPGLAPTSPLYPLSRLGLARALAMRGDKPGSHRAYADLLAAWRNADADLPALLAARAEQAALGSAGPRP